MSVNGVYAGNIFQVDVHISTKDSKLTQSQIFKKSLKKAARVVMVRLTADLDINNQDESATFLKKPRGWLKSFNYRAVKSEGVTIGKKIVFVFDKKLLYRYFENNNLLVWPASKRPVTLVYGGQKVDGLVMGINRETIRNNPKLDYRGSAARLALPIVVPASKSIALSPSKTISKQKISNLIRAASANYLLNFEETISSLGGRSFSWKLYHKNGDEILIMSTEKGSGSRHLTRMFETLLDVYSRSYREQSSFLNAINLDFIDVENFEEINKIERNLQGLKPTVHKVKLIQTKGKTVQFELVYQGTYQNFRKKLQSISAIELISDSALTGQMEVVWHN